MTTTTMATAVAVQKFEIRQGAANAPAERHQAADDAAQQRGTAAGQLAVVRQRLGKAHRNAGPDRRGKTDQKGVP
jgi:hypothetical protein